MATQASINLYSACYDGDLDVVKKSLRQGADLFSTHGEYSETPIMAALAWSQTQVSNYLLNQTKDVDLKKLLSQPSSNGENPLSFACGSCPASLVKKVAELSWPSERNRREKNGGFSPLAAGVYCNNLSSVRILLTQVDGVDYDCRDNVYGWTIEELAR